MNSPRYHIYTIDGYLISTFSCGKLDMKIIEPLQMFFSNRMLILLVSCSTYYKHELIQYNEYMVIRRNFWNQSNVCFDCDQNYIYLSRKLDLNYIDLYTHDVPILRTIRPI